jgi:hypothetical protein
MLPVLAGVKGPVRGDRPVLVRRHHNDGSASPGYLRSNSGGGAALGRTGTLQ